MTTSLSFKIIGNVLGDGKTKKNAATEVRNNDFNILYTQDSTL
jgi:hypothetical protein